MKANQTSNPGAITNPYIRLSTLCQTSSVQNYREQFEALLVQLSPRGQTQYLGYFLHGLRLDIQSKVLTHEPQTLDQAFKIARSIEYLLNQTTPNPNWNSRPIQQRAPFSQTTSLLPPSVTASSNNRAPVSSQASHDPKRVELKTKLEEYEVNQNPILAQNKFLEDTSELKDTKGSLEVKADFKRERSSVDSILGLGVESFVHERFLESPTVKVNHIMKICIEDMKICIEDKAEQESFCYPLARVYKKRLKRLMKMREDMAEQESFDLPIMRVYKKRLKPSLEDKALLRGKN